MLGSLEPLADFGTRSLVTHAFMGASFTAAIASAFLIEGTVGLVAFAAFANFTAGMWLCQSIHSLGNAFTDSDYRGVLEELGV